MVLLGLEYLGLWVGGGLGVGFLMFTPDGFFAILGGGLLLFVAAGVALDCFGKKVKNRRQENAQEQPDSGEQSVLESGRARTFVLYAVRFFIFFILCVGMYFYTDHFLGREYVIDAIEPVSPEKDRYVLYRFLQNDSLPMISVGQSEESYAFLLSQSPPRRTEENGDVPGASGNGSAEPSDYPNIIVMQKQGGPDKSLETYR